MIMAQGPRRELNGEDVRKMRCNQMRKMTAIRSETVVIFDLSDNWVCVMDQGNEEEKMSTKLLDCLRSTNVVVLRGKKNVPVQASEKDKFLGNFLPWIIGVGKMNATHQDSVKKALSGEEEKCETLITKSKLGTISVTSDSHVSCKDWLPAHEIAICYSPFLTPFKEQEERLRDSVSELPSAVSYRELGNCSPSDQQSMK
ncbi:hypothetical protein STEG23_017235 [Scotinomys teguina]